MKICAVIPSRNHFAALPQIVEELRHHDLFVFIVDDGSSAPAAGHIAALHDPANGIDVFRFDVSRGKGGAVVAAMQRAMAAGFTHALQIDADGQHDLKALSRFLELAVRYPEAVICGRPVYDATAPVGRRIGRWITHVWVWIETLSFRITDSMCGFRLYPLADCAALFAKRLPGCGMEFDTDILVRLFWRGVAPVWLGVQVRYPPQNHSNFALWRDNSRISCMHARLFLTMLCHLPLILLHRPPHPEGVRHWSVLPERGLYLGMKVLAWLCRIVGQRGRVVLLSPFVLYFFLTGRLQREASRTFLIRALGRAPTFAERWRHFLNFALRATDVLLGWTGKISRNALQADDAAILQDLTERKTGCLLVVAHYGNVEVVRALVEQRVRERVTVLVHTRHAVNFNRIMAESAGEYSDNLFQVTEIDPATVIALKERIDAGHLVVIAGDRTAVTDHGHHIYAPFFGCAAAFPEGPWILAALLECPVYLMQCALVSGRYRLTVEPFAERIVLPRAERRQVLQATVERYAARLEACVATDPLQWYNFYDFWGAP